MQIKTTKDSTSIRISEGVSVATMASEQWISGGGTPNPEEFILGIDKHSTV